ELDRLYALPLEEFTAARNDLARRLTKAGRADAAGEVKKLPKPSVPVWTANQLARREPGELRALLRSAEELRKAQERALGGKGVSDLQDRLAEQRRAVRALARLRGGLLAAGGRSGGAAAAGCGANIPPRGGAGGGGRGWGAICKAGRRGGARGGRALPAPRRPP